MLRIILVCLVVLAALSGARHMTYNVPALNATAPHVGQVFLVLSPPCNTSLAQRACNVLSDVAGASPWNKTAAAVGEAVECTFVYRGSADDTRQWLLRATGVCA